MNKKQKKVLTRIIAAAVLAVAAHFAQSIEPLEIALYLAAYLVAGYDIIIKAFKGIKNLQPFDENFLMVVATIGAVALGEYSEGAAVMIFYQTGELFQSIAVGKSRRSITELIDIRPDYANLEHEDGTIEKVSPDEIEAGTVILIKPGEKIPLDGIVEDGESSIDTAALTGESVLRTVRAGEEVLSGCINMTGVLRVKTTKEFEESTASKILDLVENASSRKSRAEDFITKFARVYTPVVCYCALALAVLPPMIRLIAGANANWGDWIYRALTFLVISCPCALVISIPLTFFAALGGSGNAGILIKGSNFMEPLSRAKIVVLDKTGTMTKGVFEVVAVHHSRIDEEKLIEYAALAESYSSHPISLSLERAYKKVPDKTRVADVHEISGEGVTATVDGHEVSCGNDKLMKRSGIHCIPCKSSGTVVHVAIDGIYSGHILIADSIKPNAPEAVLQLKKNGVKKTVMLTGDSLSTAQQVAEELDIDEFRSNLLPGDKVSAVEELLTENGKNEYLAFVGDGINDAPVLSRADVGIAMGGIGSDAAIEAADVVIMDDDPLKIAKAIRIAKKSMRIVYENIWFAIGIKLICLVLGAVGIASMWLAIFADVGVMVLAVLNAIRALNVKSL